MLDLHEALLERWRQLPRHQGQAFIADGIIDPARWERAPRRVLLLLKEAYSDEGESWDLRDKIRDEWQGPKYNTWKNAASWAYALQNWSAGSHPPFPEKPELLKEALLSAAVVNLKKSGGKSHSDWEDLETYASKDAQFLRQQVDLIDPDLIVCGSTWDHARRHIWGEEKDPRPFLPGLVWETCGRKIIAFWHPAVQWPHHLQYYALGGILVSSGLASMPRR